MKEKLEKLEIFVQGFKEIKFSLSATSKTIVTAMSILILPILYQMGFPPSHTLFAFLLTIYGALWVFTYQHYLVKK